MRYLKRSNSVFTEYLEVQDDLVTRWIVHYKSGEARRGGLLTNTIFSRDLSDTPFVNAKLNEEKFSCLWNLATD